MSKARDLDFKWKGLMGGFTFYPYQLSVGLTLRYWPCIFAPSIRIHFGLVKFWVAWIFYAPGDSPTEPEVVTTYSPKSGATP